MNLDAVREIAKANMAGRRDNGKRETGYVYYHGLRTANLAGELAGAVGGSSDVFDEVMYVGALFHDVGKGLQPHNEAGAHIAEMLLGDVCGTDEVAEICRIVRFHCVRKEIAGLPDRVLLVQDADLLDHFGSQDIWLGIHHAAASGQSQEQLVEFWTGGEYDRMVEKSRALLNFGESVRVFDDRIAFERAFIERFRTEALGIVASDSRIREKSSR